MESLLLVLAFLYSVHEGLLSNCTEEGLLLLNSALLFPFHSLGIYLVHQGDCYLNGSYFHDININNLQESLTCALPNSTMDDGEWVAPNGLPVNCSTNPFHCDIGSSLAKINISLYVEGNISSTDDGWYKCCLPTNCSDPNTNMITANIFSKCSHCTSTHCHLLLIYCRMGTD